MSRIALVLNGLICTMIAVRALSGPDVFLGEFGVELTSAMAFAEARSIHGGGFAGIAIVVWLGLFRPEFRSAALLAAAAVMLGLAFGRAVGIVVDGATDGTTLQATVAEAVLGGLALAALLRERKAASAQ